MKDFSIIIAHRGDPMGLWATIHSCEIELAGSSFDYEYVIVVNGESSTKKWKRAVVGSDLDRVLHYLHKSGKLGHLTIKQSSLSPPSARQLGAENAKGKIFFFLDNHCLVAKDYFARSMMDFERYGMHMLHSTTKFFEGDITCYEYKLKLATNFWAEAATTPKDNARPYRIAAGGHGGFAVDAATWREVGGYWTGFHGYGGEEMYFDLKMARLGKTNWIDPLVVHYHYAGQRPYARHYTKDFYKNMLMSANVIGGEDWLNKVFVSFRDKFPAPKGEKMFDILIEAESCSRERSRWLEDKSLLSLDDLLENFTAQNIAL